MAARKPVVEAPPLPTREQWAKYVEAQTAIHPQWIPPDQLCVEDVTDWQRKKAEFAAIQASERLLRDKVFRWFFPLPVEGTNNAKLPDGTVVKGVYPIDRKVDEVKLASLRAMQLGDIRPRLTQLGIDTSKFPDDALVTYVLGLHLDKLIKWKPDLAVPEYRTLTAEQAAVFEQVLEIKPGSPQLAVEPPKATP